MVRADAARVAGAADLPDAPNGARPDPAARDPVPDAATAPPLGLAPAAEGAEPDETDVRGVVPGMPVAAAGATPGENSSGCEAPDAGAPA